MDRKKRLLYPTHQTRQQFKIITQNNKKVIFIGFDGQASSTSEDLKIQKKNHQKKNH
jgi:hypothetical protein